VFQEIDHFYYYTDHLGSSAYITDVNGQVRQHLGYTPFGEVLVDEHTTGEETPYLFNGKEFDAESGFYYYGARYYDPQTALWQSVDPLATNYPGYSPYAYVLNNPQNHIDPDGMAPGDLYSSPDAAAKSFAMRYNPKSIAEDREYGGAIYRQRSSKSGKMRYAYTRPKLGGHANVSIPSAPVNKKTGRRYTVVGDIHTHGAYDRSLGHGNNVFSPADKHGNDAGGVNGYVATPNGYLQKYKPSTGKVSKVSGHVPYDKKHYRTGRPADVAKQVRARRLAPHRNAINLGQTNEFDFENMNVPKANSSTKNNNRKFQFKDGNTRG
jgi:RHS repeat-associated protein